MTTVYKYGISPASQFINSERIKKATPLNLQDGTRRSLIIIDCLKHDQKLISDYNQGKLSAFKVNMTALERFKALVILFIQVIFKLKSTEVLIERWQEIKEGSFIIVRTTDLKTASLAPSLLAHVVGSPSVTPQSSKESPLSTTGESTLASSDQIQEIRKNLSAYFISTYAESERSEAYNKAVSIMRSHSFNSSDVKGMFAAFMKDLSELVRAERFIEEENIAMLLTLLKSKGLSMREALVENQVLIKQLNHSLKNQISLVLFEEISQDVDSKELNSADRIQAILVTFQALTKLIS